MAKQKPKLDREFARKVVAVLLRDPVRAREVASIVDPEFFETDALQELVEVSKEYVTKYKGPPTKFYIREQCGEEMTKSEVYGRIMRTSLADSAFVTEHLTEWCRKQAVKRALLKSVAEVKNGNLENIVSRMQDAMSIGSTKGRGMGMRMRDLAARLERYKAPPSARGVIPTGWPAIDHIMEGGLGAGELGMFMAGPGVGKSFALVNVASKATMLSTSYARDDVGVKVFYATLELSEAKTWKRYDKLFAGKKYHDLIGKSPAMFCKKVRENIQRLTHPDSDVVIEQWPNQSLRPSMLDAHLDMLQSSYGWKPDLVIVDYLDEMAPEHANKERRFELSSIASDLRAIGVSRSVPVWSATQANRSALDKPIVTIKDVAEDMGKVRIADCVITLCGTDEERAEGRMRLFLAKMRDAESLVTIDARFDFGYGLIEAIGRSDPVKVVKAESRDKLGEQMDRWKKKHRKVKT
jgi:replicative DNA helicase